MAAIHWNQSDLDRYFMHQGDVPRYGSCECCRCPREYPVVFTTQAPLLAPEAAEKGE